MEIGAVLLLKKEGSYGVNDLARAHILLRSVAKFTNNSVFDQFLIIVPDSQVEEIEKEFQYLAQQLNINVLAENILAPQLKYYSTLRGWRKQQILKLAAAKHILCDYYITFDADVICLKHITKEDLLPKGKALLQFERRAQHPKWWKSSSRILNAKDKLNGLTDVMSVTPAILAKDVALLAQKEIEKENNTDNWVHWLCGLHQPKDPRNWLLNRYLMIKWTEYSLYYLTLLKYGLFDKYHVLCGTQAYPQKLLVHDSHPYEHWDPTINFNENCPGLFCVVGSKTFLEPQEVWNKVGPFIDASVKELTARE